MFTDYSFAPLGAHTQYNSLNTAKALTTALAKPTGATKVLMQAQTQNIRFTLDGSTPTASKGFQLKAGDPPMVVPLSASFTIQLIEETATAVLDFQYGN
jgi:hypothetical protein